MKNPNKNFDASTRLRIDLDSIVMAGLFQDMLANADNSPESPAVQIYKEDNGWFYNVSINNGKTINSPLDMNYLLSNGFAKVISQSLDQLHEYFKNEILTMANINAIISNPNSDYVLEHLDITTEFKKPHDGTVYRKVSDFYFVPSIIFLHADAFDDKNLIAVPVTKEQLSYWDIDESTLFELTYECINRRLVIGDYEADGNPDVNQGNFFHAKYEPDADNLYKTAYSYLYSSKLRQYVTENYEHGAFVSFPHPTTGFIWAKDKMRIVDSRTMSKDVLAEKTYTFNNVIHFDDSHTGIDREMKHRLYYIPCDSNKDVVRCC